MSEPFDLECTGISRRFGDVVAVDNVSMAIPRGQFFSILGPSGCGKTTLLRILAGFDMPDSGDIHIRGRRMNEVPPNRRPVNMVFQQLALFPTMTVAGNIDYGLRRQGVDRAEAERRIGDILERVGLSGTGNRRIDQLSGGQRQRVALSRCLVLNPDLLLLDEPLGALDLKLREQMKIELKHLQQDFGTTFVYITHDQSEALVLSDQVAVMREGAFEQVAPPVELYRDPATPFVAGFVGESNGINGIAVDLSAESATVRLDDGADLRGRPAGELADGDAAEIFIRPEDFVLQIGETEFDPGCGLHGSVETVLFDGANSRAEVSWRGHRLFARLPQSTAARDLYRGLAVTLTWAPEHCPVFRRPPE
jgi:spermidine/putrescine transport system ATP-binding protein